MNYRFACLIAHDTGLWDVRSLVGLKEIRVAWLSISAGSFLTQGTLTFSPSLFLTFFFLSLTLSFLHSFPLSLPLFSLPPPGLHSLSLSGGRRWDDSIKNSYLERPPQGWQVKSVSRLALHSEGPRRGWAAQGTPAPCSTTSRRGGPWASLSPRCFPYRME